MWYLSNCTEHYNLWATLEYKYFIYFSCVFFLLFALLLHIKVIKIIILFRVFWCLMYLWESQILLKSVGGYDTCNMFSINVYKSYVYFFHTHFVLELLMFFFFTDFGFYWAWIYIFTPLLILHFNWHIYFYLGVCHFSNVPLFFWWYCFYVWPIGKYVHIEARFFRAPSTPALGPTRLIHSWFRVSFPGVKRPNPIYRRG